MAKAKRKAKIRRRPAKMVVRRSNKPTAADVRRKKNKEIDVLERTLKRQRKNARLTRQADAEAARVTRQADAEACDRAVDHAVTGVYQSCQTALAVGNGVSAVSAVGMATILGGLDRVSQTGKAKLPIIGFGVTPAVAFLGFVSAAATNIIWPGSMAATVVTGSASGSMAVAANQLACGSKKEG